ncbi:TSN33 protein, partial [Chloropsis hardwickii]|nr:TSN33 protein [Chloropsis hardwickii]
VISMVMVAVGVYARLLKHAEAAVACLAVDPAILLVVVGVLTFLITFCGCVGSLRENICLLQAVSPAGAGRGTLVASRGPLAVTFLSPQFSVCLTVIFLLQLAAGVLGFVFSDKVLGRALGGENSPCPELELALWGQVALEGWCGDTEEGDTPARQGLVTPWLPPKSRNPSVLCPLPQAVINTMCGHGMQARGYLEASAFIHTNGCIDKLVNWTHSNLFLLGGIALGLALPQVRG